MASRVKAFPNNNNNSDNNSPTSKTLPARGVGRGLRTSNNLQPQTTVSTVCPRIYHPETQLSKPYLIATKPSKPWSCGSRRRKNLILHEFHNRCKSRMSSVCRYVVGAVACSATKTTTVLRRRNNHEKCIENNNNGSPVAVNFIAHHSLTSMR